MSEKAIKVRELCGEYCISDRDAKNLADSIEQRLANNEQATLDFEGVNTVLTAFFNGLLGKLFQNYSYEQIHDLVRFNGSTPERVESKYRQSLDMAKTFFDKPEERQKVIRQRINQVFDSIDPDNV